MTVTLTVNTEGTATSNVQVAAYQAPFAAGDIGNAARYLGDPGTSSGSPPVVTTFMATIPANTDYDLVVFSTNPSPASQGAAYTLTVSPGTNCTLTGVLGTAPSGNICSVTAAPPGGEIGWASPVRTVDSLLGLALLNFGSRVIY